MQQSIPLGGGTNVVNVIFMTISVGFRYLRRNYRTWHRCNWNIVHDEIGMRAHGTTITQGLTFRFNPSATNV